MEQQHSSARAHGCILKETRTIPIVSAPTYL